MENIYNLNFTSERYLTFASCIKLNFKIIHFKGKKNNSSIYNTYIQNKYKEVPMNMFYRERHFSLLTKKIMSF